MTAEAARLIHKLPGPRGLPIVGNALQIRPKEFHRQLEGWARQYGDFFTFRIANRRFLAISRPDVIAGVLRDRPDGFRRTRRLEQVSREYGFLGLFSANGDTWRRQRPMVLSGLDPAHIRNFFPSLVDVTERLRRRWAQAAASSVEIDLQADLMRYTVDVTTGLAFGQNLNTLDQASHEEAIQQHLNVVMPELFLRILVRFDLPRWMRSARARAHEREVQGHLAALRRAVDGFIARTRALLDARPELRVRPENLIQALVANRDAPGSGLTDEDVSGNVLTMLLAGEDTTANTLAWMIWLLSRNPAAAAAARAETDQVLQGRGGVMAIDELAQLAMVEACANETMRLKPVAPFIVNEALQDKLVGDVLVTKGSFVICLMRPGGLEARNFPDPDSFDPQRWLLAGAPHAASSTKRQSMPFGAGPRMCPGRYLALAEIKMVAAMLLANFELEAVGAPGRSEPDEQISIVMSPVGLRMRLKPRRV